MKIFASDYDGTIKVDGVVSEENLKLLKEWKKQGNHFGIVTGRSSESMMQEIEAYEYDLDFLICNNGGVIYDQDFQLLKVFSIDFDIALQLIEELKNMQINCFVLNDGYHRAKQVVCSEFEDYKYGSYSSDYTVDKIIENKKVCQIVVSVNDDSYAKQIAQHLNEKYKGKLEAYTNVNCVDIVPYQISKATGLEYIAKQYGYPASHIYTMGDASNDESMLDLYGGATLVHGFDEIKKEGIYVSKDVSEYLKLLLK